DVRRRDEPRREGSTHLLLRSQDRHPRRDRRDRGRDADGRFRRPQRAEDRLLLEERRAHSRRAPEGRREVSGASKSRSADGTTTSAANRPASTPMTPTVPKSRSPSKRQAIRATKPADVVSAVAATRGPCSRSARSRSPPREACSKNIDSSIVTPK